MLRKHAALPEEEDYKKSEPVSRLRCERVYLSQPVWVSVYEWCGLQRCLKQSGMSCGGTVESRHCGNRDKVWKVISMIQLLPDKGTCIVKSACNLHVLFAKEWFCLLQLQCTKNKIIWKYTWHGYTHAWMHVLCTYLCVYTRLDALVASYFSYEVTILFVEHQMEPIHQWR